MIIMNISRTRTERLHVLLRVGLGCCVFHIAGQASQSPFGGAPWSIPGTIEVENFDEGGEGVAYHDSTATNEGGVYRNTAVDIFASPDTSNGYYVGLGRGEWLEYTVNIDETGSYDFYSIIRRGYNPQEFHLLLDGVEVSGPIAAPDFRAGLSSGYGEASKQGIVLKAGQHVLRLHLSRVNPEPTGNVLNVDFDNLRMTHSTLIPSQVISGSGQPGFADGAPDSAQFSANITGLDVDLAGNIYVADWGNYRVRKVSSSGHATTIAGNRTDGTANGAGDQAQFSILRGVAVDDLGNCYVTDGSSSDGLNKIRKITSDLQVSTLYSEARGTFADFSSITLNLSGEVHFVTSSISGILVSPWYIYTISKLSPSGSKIDVLTIHGTGAAGTTLHELSSGHSSEMYYLSYPYMVGISSSDVDRLDATGGSTLLYSTGYSPRPRVLHGLVADRSGNIYFGVANNLSRLPRSGAPEMGYASTGMPDAFATDISGNVYAFENNRLIKLLMNYPGVDLTAFTDGGGVVTVDPHGPVYVTNSVVQVTAAAWSGWTFLGWTNDLSGTQTNLTLTMTNHVSLQALFGMPLLTSATNGTVLRDLDYGLYPYGTLVQLTAQPDIGFEFIHWSDGITNPVRVVGVTNLIVLSPLFSALPKYTLTVAALGGLGGTVSRSPDQAEYFRDTPVIVSAYPANGYIFQVWLDNVLDNPRTVIMSSNMTLFAAFAQGQGTAPQITSAPQSTNVFVGGQAIFNVAAQGSSPLTYQWQFKGTNIPGAVAPKLIISQVQTNHAGTYTIKVSNSIDTATADAVLNVFTPFAFETISIQSDRRFQLMLSGDAGSRYQIDRSEDLTNWRQLTVVTNTTGLAQFAEPIVAGVGQRFYRALLLPSQ